MNKFLWSALALAALAAPAAAQTPVIVKGTGTTGEVRISNVFPDWFTPYYNYQAICQNSLANTGAASDSSQAYVTIGASWIALSCHYSIPAAVRSVLVALQVRRCKVVVGAGGTVTGGGVDSTSVSGWEIIRSVTPNAGGAAARDSLGVMMVGSPFEKVSAIAYGIQPNEIAVWLSNTEPSRDKFIMLCHNGVYFRAAATAIRWRVVTAFDGAMAAVTTGSTSIVWGLEAGR
jgi:hypothetical protein